MFNLKLTSCLALSLVLVLVGSIDLSAQTPLKPFGVPLKNLPGPDVKSGDFVKVGSDLAALFQEYEAQLSGTTSGPFKSSNPMMKVHDGLVVIDAVAEDKTSSLQGDLDHLGLQGGAAFGRLVSGWLPISAIREMAVLDSLRFARPSYSMTHVGLTTSQGDAAMRSDEARTLFGVDGAGITVGTLSDSFNCLGGAATDMMTGDLPSGIVVLDDTDCSNGSDEGRAMMQIIADVAPGASQAFHTAGPGVAGFAQGIRDLATVAEVIVDDVIFFTEPMFQDGPIAQAVDEVVALGASYFSSAGNNARQSYEGPFVPSGFTVSGVFEAHDFDPGGGVDVLQSITIPVGAGPIVLQWDQPSFSVSGSPGSSNDVDIYLLNDLGTVFLGAGISTNVGGDPVEIVPFVNPGPAMNFNLVIERITPPGTGPGSMKYVIHRGGAINEYDTASSTVYGHANAASAEAVAAAFYAIRRSSVRILRSWRRSRLLDRRRSCSMRQATQLCRSATSPRSSALMAGTPLSSALIWSRTASPTSRGLQPQPPTRRDSPLS